LDRYSPPRPYEDDFPCAPLRLSLAGSSMDRFPPSRPNRDDHPCLLFDSLWKLCGQVPTAAAVQRRPSSSILFGCHFCGQVPTAAAVQRRLSLCAHRFSLAGSSLDRFPPSRSYRDDLLVPLFDSLWLEALWTDFHRPACTKTTFLVRLFDSLWLKALWTDFHRHGRTKTTFRVRLFGSL
jgi:hypothetical protein